MAKGSTDQIIVADVGDEVQRGREDSAHEMTFFPGEKDLKRKESVEPVNMAEGHVDDDRGEEGEEEEDNIREDDERKANDVDDD